MKRKVLMLMMLGLLGTSVFMSGCGSSTNDIMEDDPDIYDEEEEDDGEIPELVDSISEDELSGQIDVIVANREMWTSPATQDSFFRVSYCVSDMDHNGRAEIITTCVQGDSPRTDLYIWEINKNGDGLKSCDWKYTNIDFLMNTYPALDSFSYWDSYVDSKDNSVHYVISSVCGDGDISGTQFSDVKLYKGTVTDDIFGFRSYDPNTGDEHYYIGGDEVNFADFFDYIESYSGDDSSSVFFGQYETFEGDDRTLNDTSEDELKNILHDSYMVFTGELSYEDFENQI
jgi:hypothetical protein